MLTRHLLAYDTSATLSLLKQPLYSVNIDKHQQKPAEAIATKDVPLELR